MRSSEIVRSNRPLQVHPTTRMQRGYNSARPNQRRRPGRVQRVDKTGEAFIGSGNRVSRKRDATHRRANAPTPLTHGNKLHAGPPPAGRSASPGGFASADGAESGRHGPMHRTTVLLPIRRRADGPSAPVSLPRPAPRVRPTPALTRLPPVTLLPVTRLSTRTVHERRRRGRLRTEGHPEGRQGSPTPGARPLPDGVPLPTRLAFPRRLTRRSAPCRGGERRESRDSARAWPGPASEPER